MFRRPGSSRQFQNACLSAAILSFMLILGFVSPVAVEACGDPPKQPDVPAANMDRSWVSSTGVIYGASYERGIYKVRLSSNGIEPIGDHAGWSIASFRISDDKRKLYYHLSKAGRATHWIYDIEKSRETNLQAIAKDLNQWGSVEISPNSERIAWTPRPSEGSRVVVLDLTTEKSFSYRIPLERPDRGTLLFGETWSRDGKAFLVGRRWKDAEDFWSINADSGSWQKISGTRIGEGFDRSIHYLRDGVNIGNSCIQCGRPRGSLAIYLSGGVFVRLIDNRFVVEKPGSEPLEFASATPIPPQEPDRIEMSPDGMSVTTISSSTCITSGPKMLLGQFDNRYIVYAHDGAYWLYGLEEKRKAMLLKGSGNHLTW